jgi:hypothetical protein
MKHTKATWLKVTVNFVPPYDLAESAMDVVRAFEATFSIPHIYFSRYVDAVKNSVEISCLTDTPAHKIKSYFRHKSFVTDVTVENRGTGSLAHAYAYLAVSMMPHYDKDSDNNWKEMLDVVHWMQNMRGFDYYREIRFYGYAAFCFANQIAQQHSEVRAKMAGKAPDSKAAVSAAEGGRQSKRSRSARGALHRASG